MKVRNSPPVKVIDLAKINGGVSEWEYKSFTAERDIPEALRTIGERGWELVSVLPEAGSRVTYWFKRRKHGIHGD